MPRQARIDAPGALHHIICRGIERRLIFKDDLDRDDFVSRLAAICSETSTECLAWALLPNHFHLLLRTGSVPVATIMRRLLTGFAVKFNHRHKRHGHLFQNRYKSILCQEELYLLELVRYIHLNPLRARQVANLDLLRNHPYCGHSRLMGKLSDGWQSTAPVLERFGQRLLMAQKGYENFVADGLSQGKRKDLVGGGLIRSYGGWHKVKQNRRNKLASKGDERILGDGDFVDAVLRQAEEVLERKAERDRQGITFDFLLSQTVKLFELEPQDLLRPGKQPARVAGRSILCYWAVVELGMTATAVGKKIGLTQPAVSRAVQRGAKLIKEEGFDFPDVNA